ncbi:hypothetical protein FRC11_001117 [Ceratobasidium sp. 423]|nr:hypothetical protein FRC11_001117 [Ceratobasidium sp. 423]
MLLICLFSCVGVDMELSHTTTAATQDLTKIFHFKPLQSIDDSRENAAILLTDCDLVEQRRSVIELQEMLSRGDLPFRWMVQFTKATGNTRFLGNAIATMVTQIMAFGQRPGDECKAAWAWDSMASRVSDMVVYQKHKAATLICRTNPGSLPWGHPWNNSCGCVEPTTSGGREREWLPKEYNQDRPIMSLIFFDTPWSTIHLANVPTHPHDSAPVFDQAEVAGSVLSNLALASLSLTSQPPWFGHPSNINSPRSSVVLSFEDPDGAIARQLLKTPIFIFGYAGYH